MNYGISIAAGLYAIGKGGGVEILRVLEESLTLLVRACGAYRSFFKYLRLERLGPGL